MTIAFTLKFHLIAAAVGLFRVYYVCVDERYAAIQSLYRAHCLRVTRQGQPHLYLNGRRCRARIGFEKVGKVLYAFRMDASTYKMALVIIAYESINSLSFSNKNAIS